MRTLRSSVVAFVLVFLGLLFPIHSGHPETAEQKVEQEWEATLETLDVLWGGTREERLRFLEESAYLFEALEDPPKDRAPQVHATVESLRSLFANDRDEWFLDRLALALAEGDEALTPLFLDLLEHRSLNVRWRAVEHFYLTEETVATPSLVALWREPLPPWIRIDLIDALEDLDWDPLGTECLPLMDSEHLELSVRAIETVGHSEAPGAVSGLVRRAARGRVQLRVAAVDALGGWAESAEALQAVLKASYTKEPSVRVRAIRSLGAFELEKARRRVHAAAIDIHEDPTVRLASVTILERDGDRIAVDTLIRIATEPDSGSNVRIRQNAGNALRRMGVVGFAPPPMPFANAVDPLTGHWMTQVNPNAIQGMEIITAGVGIRFDGSPAGSDHGFLLLPNNGARSTRCWAGPEIAADPPDRPRVETGWWIRAIKDYFDDRGRVWVEFWTYRETCWVPLEFLEEPNGTNRPAVTRPEDPALVVELDAPVEAADSSLAWDLRTLGVLTLFDETERVIAFRLDGRDLDDVTVSKLLERLPDDDSALSGALSALLVNIARNTENEDLASQILEAIPGSDQD